jgi:hypothetical protein
MNKAGFALGAALLIAQAPAAQAQSRETVLSTVSKADLRLLVTLEGHTITEEDFYDVPSVRGKTKDGLIFQVSGSNCSDGPEPRCRNVMMQIRYDDDDRVTYEGINEANWSEAMIATWWDKEGKTVGFTRFVVLDGGVTLMNLRQNLRAMFTYVPTVLKYPFP